MARGGLSEELMATIPAPALSSSSAIFFLPCRPCCPCSILSCRGPHVCRCCFAPNQAGSGQRQGAGAALHVARPYAGPEERLCGHIPARTDVGNQVASECAFFIAIAFFVAIATTIEAVHAVYTAIIVVGACWRASAATVVATAPDSATAAATATAAAASRFLPVLRAIAQVHGLRPGRASRGPAGGVCGEAARTRPGQERAAVLLSDPTRTASGARVRFGSKRCIGARSHSLCSELWLTLFARRTHHF